jgi:D-amino-acid dehydrogenase
MANVFYNTGHGHLGWTLSAVTADMVAQVVARTSGVSLAVSSDAA